jgi:hypothetical protein
MLIIRRLNCIDAASGIVTLINLPSGAQVERELRSLSTCAPDGHLMRVTIPDAALNTIQPPDDEHIMLLTCRGL